MLLSKCGHSKCSLGRDCKREKHTNSCTSLCLLNYHKHILKVFLGMRIWLIWRWTQNGSAIKKSTQMSLRGMALRLQKCLPRHIFSCFFSGTSLNSCLLGGYSCNPWDIQGESGTYLCQDCGQVE